MGEKRIYNYKEYVDKSNIDINQEDRYRYSLFIPFKKSASDKHVLVIMRNPSQANKEISDKTINNVLSFCHERYSGVYMYNLYPYYETDSTKLKDFINSECYESKMDKNIEVLDTLLQDVDEVIIAWGTSSAGAKYQKNYEENIDLILKKVESKNVLAMRFVSTKNPWHPRNWEDGFSLELYPWEKTSS